MDIIKYLTTLDVNPIIISMISLGIWLVLNHRHVFDLFEYRQKSKLKNIETALKSEHLKGLTKLHLEKALTTEHFYLSTGIRVEEKFREAIITEHQNTHGEIAFRHFKRALPHFYFEQEQLIIRVTKVETWMYWYGIIAGSLVLITGALSLLIPLYLLLFTTLEDSAILSYIISGITFIPFGIFMLIEGQSVFSAKLIQKYREQIKKTKN